MLFNSLPFLFGFLPITYLVFWLLRSAQSRYVWLAITGYIFYGWWDPRFCLLMAFSTLVSYAAGLALGSATTARARKWCLVLPITVDLCLLGFFKYSQFLVDNAVWLSERFGAPLPRIALDIVLPVGISFYTFHTISYIVDVYRGLVKPTRNIFEFAAYVSLFSQLVAGPIVRFRQIEDDLEAIGTASRVRWLAPGVAFFLFGMCEKVLLADHLALWVDVSFKDPCELSTASSWLLMSAYSLQLYFDFSGYSSMAVGLGLMFGLHIPQNFNSPYRAVNPADFWRRWHISLSTCMRDYLFIPLGGSRCGDVLTARNLLLTMLIGGIWHGAHWTFVVWGLYHGCWLVFYRSAERFWNRVPLSLQRLATALIVIVGWTLFRSTDMQMASCVIERMFAPTPGQAMANWQGLLGWVSAAGLLATIGPNAFEAFKNYQWRPWHGIIMAAVFGICLAMILREGESPFLYFQF